MVRSRLQRLVEELEDLRDSHGEYVGVIDGGDIEALEIHNSIGVQLKHVSLSISRLRRARSVDIEDLEEIEELLSDVGEAFIELAASL